MQNQHKIDSINYGEQMVESRPISSTELQVNIQHHVVDGTNDQGIRASTADAIPFPNQTFQQPLEAHLPGNRYEKRMIKSGKPVKKGAGSKAKDGQSKGRSSAVRRGQASRATNNMRSKDECRGHREASGSRERVKRKKHLQTLLMRVQELQTQLQRIPQNKSQHYVDPYLRIGAASRLNLGVGPEGSHQHNPTSAGQEDQELLEQKRQLIQDRAQQFLEEFKQDKEQSREESPHFKKLPIEKNSDVNVDPMEANNAMLSLNSVQYQSANIEPNTVSAYKEGSERCGVKFDTHEANCCTCKSSGRQDYQAEQLNSADQFDQVAKTLPQIAMLDQEIPSARLVESQEKKVKYKLPVELESARECDKCDHCGGTCNHTPTTSKDKQLPSMRVDEDSSKGPITNTEQTNQSHVVIPNILTNPNCCAACGFGGSEDHVSSVKVRSGSIPPMSPNTIALRDRKQFVQPITTTDFMKNATNERYYTNPVSATYGKIEDAVKGNYDSQENQTQDRGQNSEIVRMSQEQIQEIENPRDLVLNGEQAMIDVRIKDTGSSLGQEALIQRFSEANFQAESNGYGIIGSTAHIKSKRYSANQNKKRTRSGKNYRSPPQHDVYTICTKCNRPKSTSKSRSRSRSASGNKRGQRNRMKPKSQLALNLPKMAGSDEKADKDDINQPTKNRRYCPVHGFRDITSPTGPPTAFTEIQRKKHNSCVPNDDTLWVHESHKPSDSNVTETVTVMSKKIRDSISFTSMTRTAREIMNLNELNSCEQDELSDLLMSELQKLADGNFVLCGDPMIISSRQVSVQMPSEHKKINVLELGAHSVINEEAADLAAQSNIATNFEAESANYNQTSVIIHTENDDRHIRSGTKAIYGARDSAAYGSEIEYQQVGVGVILTSKQEDQEESEEQYESVEEEYEEELSEEQAKVEEIEEKSEEEQISRRTSFSSFYIIDEQEEQRLKQIAFERFIKEQQSSQITVSERQQADRNESNSTQKIEPVLSEGGNETLKSSRKKTPKYQMESVTSMPATGNMGSNSVKNVEFNVESENGEAKPPTTSSKFAEQERTWDNGVQTQSLHEQTDRKSAELQPTDEAEAQEEQTDLNKSEYKLMSSKRGSYSPSRNSYMGDQSRMSQGEQTQYTQKAFNNQKLYEEVPQLQENHFTLNSQPTLANLQQDCAINKDKQSQQEISEIGADKQSTVYVHAGERSIDQDEDQTALNRQSTVNQNDYGALQQDGSQIQLSDAQMVSPDARDQHNLQEKHRGNTDRNLRTYGKGNNNVSCFSNLKPVDGQIRTDQSHGGIPVPTEIKRNFTDIPNQRHAQSTHNQEMNANFYDEKQPGDRKISYGHVELKSPFNSKYQSQMSNGELRNGSNTSKNLEQKQPSRPMTGKREFERPMTGKSKKSVAFNQDVGQTDLKMLESVLFSQEQASLPRLLSEEYELKENKEKPGHQENKDSKTVEIVDQAQFSDKGIQMESELFSDKKIAKEPDSNRDMTTEQEALKPILIDKSCQDSRGFNQQTYSVKDSEINGTEQQPAELQSQTFAATNSDAQNISQQIEQTIKNNKSREIQPYQSSYDGDIKPQHPIVDTPDTNKREIAQQIRANIDEIPQNRNNYRSMTGDELEPGKPTIIEEHTDNDADAYIKQMMAQQKFYMPDAESEEASEQAIPPQTQNEVQEQQVFSEKVKNQLESHDYESRAETMALTMIKRTSTMTPEIAQENRQVVQIASKLFDQTDKNSQESFKARRNSDIDERLDSSPRQAKIIEEEDSLPSSAKVVKAEVQMFRADLDKTQADISDQYVTLDKRPNGTIEFQTDSYRARPMVQQTEEKEPNRPDFSKQGIAPFEKSDNKKRPANAKRGRGGNKYDDHEAARRNNQSNSRERAPDLKTKKTKEEADNYLKFLNSKKYGSEGPLSGQSDSKKATLPQNLVPSGVQSQGNFHKKKSGSVTKPGRKVTDASYFKQNTNSNSTVRVGIHIQDQEKETYPIEKRNTVSSHELTGYNPEKHVQLNQSLNTTMPDSGYMQRPHHQQNPLIINSGSHQSSKIPTRGSKNTRFVNNIYDSPKNSREREKKQSKLISASSDIGYRVIAPKPNSLWNENTEQNIRTMLNKRANKRMKEISEDFDIAMHPHSVTVSKQKRGKYSEAGLTPQIIRKQERFGNSNTDNIVRRRVESEIGGSSNTQRQIANSILAHSGAQSLTGPNINVRSIQNAWVKQQQLYDSDDENQITFDQNNASGIYQTCAKQNTINEHSEHDHSSSQHIQQRTMSNFSAQYNNFKDKKSGKSQERRNINVSGKNGFVHNAMFFKGDEVEQQQFGANDTGMTLHELVQKGVSTTGRTNPVDDSANQDIRAVQTPLMRDETISPELNDSQRVLLNQSVNYYRSSAGNNNSMLYADQKNKNKMYQVSPNTNLNGSYASTQASALQASMKKQSVHPSMFINPSLVQTAMRPTNSKLQFYPQKKYSTGRNIGRVQSSSKPGSKKHTAYLSKPGHLENSIVHDNMNAPYLHQSKNNKTTAYL